MVKNNLQRQEILDACEFLQKKELIARTWGNVSAKASSEFFLITPSGLAYERTQLEDIVLVKIEDCSYNKVQRKPSSEKKVHAEAYKARPDIKYVVHTHQFYASAICADECSVTLSDGTFVPCAAYGLPGTNKLKNNCAEVFNKFKDANMFLLAKHGAITFGKTMKEALNNAVILEKECKKLFEKRVPKFYIPKQMEPYLDDYAQMFPIKNAEDFEAIKMVAEKNAAAMLYAVNSKPIDKFDAKLQNLVYKLKYSKLRDKK